MSEERDAIQPELEVALAHFAQVYRKPQDQLPIWLYECLAQYGVACCQRGLGLAHKKRTLKPSNKGPWDDEPTALDTRWDDDEEHRG